MDMFERIHIKIYWEKADRKVKKADKILEIFSFFFQVKLGLFMCSEYKVYIKRLKELSLCHTTHLNFLIPISFLTIDISNLAYFVWD